MSDMMAHLHSLADGVRHMSQGDPDCDDCVQASDVVQWAIDEIERLRLTDAEREAIRWAEWEGPLRSQAEGAEERAAVLRGLLERTK